MDFTQKSDRERIGFNVLISSHTQGVWSRIGSEPRPGNHERRARQYAVDLTSSSGTSGPEDRGYSRGPGHRVCGMEETGKMALSNQPLIQAVRQTLSTPGTVVLGTIPDLKESRDPGGRAEKRTTFGCSASPRKTETTFRRIL